MTDETAPNGEPSAGPAKPEWLPDTLWDPSFGFKGAHYQSMVWQKAEHDARVVPGAPAGYVARLPAGHVHAADVEFNADDPQLAAAREFAHGMGSTQEEFEQLLAVGVAGASGDVARINNAVAKERVKLGGRAVARIKAVADWLDSKLGADLGSALHGYMFSAVQVEAFERLMAANLGDIPGNPGAARSASNTISDEEYDAMSPVEKLNYARTTRR